MSHTHVVLTEPVSGARAAATEMVPATDCGGGLWRIEGTPGLVNGCAAGDVVRVLDDGTFMVVQRGGNVAAHVYSRVPLPESALLRLKTGFQELEGLVEWPETRQFVVVTVPATAGFHAIEAHLEEFTSQQTDVEWVFGNVYDESDRPLNWW